MEIVVALCALCAYLVAALLVATGGRPRRIFSEGQASLERLWANRGPLALTALSLLLVLGFVYFFYASPATRIGPAQPIAFSHRLHAADKAIDCRFCHSYVARSNHPGLPPVEKCLFCHNYIIAGHPEILKEHAYFDTDTPTPWVKVFYVAEHVLFNHQRHVRQEIDCEVCHGEVRAQDRLKGQRFKMGFCVECHREREANLDCWLACHS